MKPRKTAEFQYLENGEKFKAKLGTDTEIKTWTKFSDSIATRPLGNDIYKYANNIHPERLVEVI